MRRIRIAAPAVALACLLIAAPRTSAATPATDEPLNIVVLYADDWRHDVLGAAGHPIVKTPALDRLAADGVRFTRNYVTTSICGVSRASLFTGQWMSRHGNEAFAMFKTPWRDTFPARLRAAGYWVGHVGKWHNGTFPAAEYDFGDGRITPMRHWLKQPDGTTIHVTQKNENDALEFLRTRPKRQPCCLTVAFVATHAEDRHPRQFLPQPASLSLYADERIPLPTTATPGHFRRLPPFLANEKNEGRVRWHWRFDEPEKYQTMMKNYYRMATEVDAVCGRVIEELERQGVRERTLIVFTTDNGYFHGEHELADKWYPYEESIRVPLIVWDPRMPAARRGTTDAAMTLNVDLAPTFLAAARVEAPPSMQGRDMSALWLGERPADWRTEFFYEHPTIRSIDFIPASQALVRSHEKYILWPDFGREELFDLEADPHEERDVAGDANQAARLAEMRRRFAQLKADAARGAGGGPRQPPL